MKRLNFYLGLLVGLFAVVCSHNSVAAETTKITASGDVIKIQGQFAFTEGPAAAEDGTLYFTDIPNDTIHVLAVGGQVEVFVKPAGHANGLLLAPDGQVTRVSGDLPAPNGIGMSLDGKRLYVIPSQSAKMLVFDIESPGKLSDPRVFCHLKQPAGQSDSGGDGMAMDVQGNLYITTNLGILPHLVT